MPQSSSLVSEAGDEVWSAPDLFHDSRFTPDAATSSQRQTAQHNADERLAQLARAIELEIIPRLMLAHRAANECIEVEPTVGRRLEAADVAAFAQLVLTPGEDGLFACVEALRGEGVPVESLYLDLLAPAARHLGALWEEDLCDFTEVTIGLGRLQRVLRELSPAFHDGEGVDASAPAGRRVLLLPCPGEQHTFGLVMVSEFFRRAGWDVAGGSWELGMDASNLVAADWYDVVGFSLAAEVHLDELNRCIEAVRLASRNASIGVIVGGPLFSLQPELHARVAADLVACDGKQAPMLAEQLLALRGSLAG